MPNSNSSREETIWIGHSAGSAIEYTTSIGNSSSSNMLSMGPIYTQANTTPLHISSGVEGDEWTVNDEGYYVYTEPTNLEINWADYFARVNKEPTLVERYKRKNMRISGLVQFLENHQKGGLDVDSKM